MKTIKQIEVIKLSEKEMAKLSGGLPPKEPFDTEPKIEDIADVTK